MRDIQETSDELEPVSPEAAAAELMQQNVAAGAELAKQNAGGAPGHITGRWKQAARGGAGGNSEGDARRKLPKTIGEYEVLDEINRGGMGIVYKAVDPKLKRLVAIKVLLAGDGARNEDLLRFQREAQATARLQHPNIVPIYATGSFDGKPYLVMDFVEGRTAKQLKEEGRISPRLALSIIEGVADGLHHAHLHGVVHRDVKPANIMVDKQERVQLMDFGLARRVDEDLEVTRAGTTMGTPSYMSPEQAEGNLKNVDAQSDVYSAGACLYELLTGRSPFDGPTIMVVLRKVMEDTPVPPRKLNSKIHKDVETICLKCLEKGKAHRYLSARELAEDIRRFNAGEAINAKPLGRWALFFRGARRHKGIVAVLLVTLLAFIFLLIDSRLQARAQVEKQEQALKSALDEGKVALAKADDAVAALGQAQSPGASLSEFQQQSARARTFLSDASNAFSHAEGIAPENAQSKAGLERLKKLENDLEVRHFINKAQLFLNPPQGPDEPLILPNYASAEFAAQEALDRDPGNVRARELLHAAAGIRKVTVDTEPEGVQVFAARIVDALGRQLRHDPGDLGKDLGLTPVQNKELEPGTYILTFHHAGNAAQQATLAVSRDTSEEWLHFTLPLYAKEENMAWIHEGNVSLPQVGVTRIPAFAIDRFEYPNKAGVVPTTGVSLLEAQGLCREKNKQLCTSGQWLRACMGDKERRYPYGKDYISQTCAAGFDANVQKQPMLAGIFTRCHTPDGIYDMSGNAAEWTDSEHGDSDSQETVFGGDWTSSFSVPDITISCRGRRLAAEVSKEQLGFRCCKVSK